MPVPVKIDTDVNWTMMPTRDCISCFKYDSEKCGTIYNEPDKDHSCGEGFDPSPAYATLVTKGVQRTYGSTKLNGKIWHDTMCVGYNCLIDFEFFSYHKEKIFSNTASSSSVIGLSQSNPNYNTGPSFTDYLYRQLMISKSSFSLAMNGYDSAAYLDFGDPLKSRTKTNSTSIYLYANYEIFWSVFIQGVSFAPEMVLENS